MQLKLVAKILLHVITTASLPTNPILSHNLFPICENVIKELL